MYKTNQQTLKYLRELQTLTGDIPRAELVLFILPSYLALAEACQAANPNMLWIGAQNMHWAEQGPFTGEVSPLMLQDVGVNLVMVGHAERRTLFGETDQMVNLRLLSSLSHGFQTLLCVGDTREEFIAGSSSERLRQQLLAALCGVEPKQLEKLWIAYEPVWAIGESGTVADPGFANGIHSYLHQVMNELFPTNVDQIPVLYGGSVNPDNAVSLITQPDIDGLFIGRAAWDVECYSHMVHQISTILHEKNVIPQVALD